MRVQLGDCTVLLSRGGCTLEVSFTWFGVGCRHGCLLELAADTGLSSRHNASEKVGSGDECWRPSLRFVFVSRMRCRFATQAFDPQLALGSCTSAGPELWSRSQDLPLRGWHVHLVPASERRGSIRGQFIARATAIASHLWSSSIEIQRSRCL